MVTDTSGATVSSINPLTQQQALRAAGIASTVRYAGITAALEQQKRSEEYIQKQQAERLATQQAVQQAAEKAQTEYEQAKAAQEAQIREAQDWEFAKNLVFGGRAGASRGDTSTQGKVTSTQHKVQYLQQHGYRSAEVMAQAREVAKAAQTAAVSESTYKDLQARAEAGKKASEELSKLMVKGQVADSTYNVLRSTIKEGQTAQQSLGKVGTITTTTQYAPSIIKDFEKSGVKISYEAPTQVTTKEISQQKVSGPMSALTTISGMQPRVDIGSLPTSPVTKEEAAANLFKAAGLETQSQFEKVTGIKIAPTTPELSNLKLAELSDYQKWVNAPTTKGFDEWRVDQGLIKPEEALYNKPLTSLETAEQKLKDVKVTKAQREKYTMTTTNLFKDAGLDTRSEFEKVSGITIKDASKIKITAPTVVEPDLSKLIYFKKGGAVSESIYNDLEKKAKEGNQQAKDLIDKWKSEGVRKSNYGSYKEESSDRSVVGYISDLSDIYSGSDKFVTEKVPGVGFVIHEVPSSILKFGGKVFDLITGKEKEVKRQEDINKRLEEIQLKNVVLAENQIKIKVDDFAKKEKERADKSVEQKIKDSGFEFTKTAEGKITIYFDPKNKAQQAKYDKLIEDANKRYEKTSKDVNKYADNLVKNTGVFLGKEAEKISKQVADESLKLYHPIKYASKLASEFNIPISAGYTTKTGEYVTQFKTDLSLKKVSDKALTYVEGETPTGTMAYLQQSPIVSTVFPAISLFGDRDIRAARAIVAGGIKGVRDKPVEIAGVIGLTAATAGLSNLAQPAILTTIGTGGAKALGLGLGAAYGVSIIGRVAATPGDYLAKSEKLGELATTEIIPGYIGFKAGSWLVPPKQIVIESIKKEPKAMELAEPPKRQEITAIGQPQTVYVPGKGKMEIQMYKPTGDVGYTKYQQQNEWEYLVQTPGTRFKQISNFFRGRPLNEDAFLRGVFKGAPTTQFVYMDPGESLFKVKVKGESFTIPTGRTVITETPRLGIKSDFSGPKLYQPGIETQVSRESLLNTIITSQEVPQTIFTKAFLGGIENYPILKSKLGTDYSGVEKLYFKEAKPKFVTSELGKGVRTRTYFTETYIDGIPGYDINQIETVITPKGGVTTTKALGKVIADKGLRPLELYQEILSGKTKMITEDLKDISLSSAPLGVRIQPIKTTTITYRTSPGEEVSSFGMLGTGTKQLFEKGLKIFGVEPKAVTVKSTYGGTEKILLGDTASSFLTTQKPTKYKTVEYSAGTFSFPEKQVIGTITDASGKVSEVYGIKGPGAIVDQYKGRVVTPKTVGTEYSYYAKVKPEPKIEPKSVFSDKSAVAFPDLYEQQGLPVRTEALKDVIAKKLVTIDYQAIKPFKSVPNLIGETSLLFSPSPVSIPVSTSYSAGLFAFSSAIAPQMFKTPTVTRPEVKYELKPEVTTIEGMQLIMSPRVTTPTDESGSNRSRGGGVEILRTPVDTGQKENVVQQPVVVQPQPQIQFPQIITKNAQRTNQTFQFAFNPNIIHFDLTPPPNIDTGKDDQEKRVGKEPRKKKKKQLGPGYEVLIKRRVKGKKRVFVPLRVSLVRSEAETLAMQELLKGPEATAKLVPSKAPIKPTQIKVYPRSDIRKYFRTGKAGEIIQKERARIVTAAERKAITGRGLAGRRSRPKGKPYKKKNYKLIPSRYTK